MNHLMIKSIVLISMILECLLLPVKANMLTDISYFLILHKLYMKQQIQEMLNVIHVETQALFQLFWGREIWVESF